MTLYTCPMHPEVVQDSPGKCPKCGGMDLVPQGTVKKQQDIKPTGLLAYKPLFIIIGLIAFAALLGSIELATGKIFGRQFMAIFMASFFFVFSGFKLLNLKGFATGYSTYDLLAQRLHTYALLYPFIELALGIGYIVAPLSFILNSITAIVMVFGGIGVSIKVAKKESFTCACLGTFIDVPLTYITLIEDFGMAAMALVMLSMS
jgi:hypothetical protein